MTSQIKISRHGLPKLICILTNSQLMLNFTGLKVGIIKNISNSFQFIFIKLDYLKHYKKSLKNGLNIKI